MTSRGSPLSRAWIFVPLLACVFVLWSNGSRIQRIQRVSEVGAEALKPEASSPTGYQHGLRKLIVPEHNAVSYELIGQTQQMFAQGDWRVRHVEYDNAPTGRDSHSASIYRWWLGLVAKTIQLIRGGSIGTSVEAAALWAGPLLHVLVLLSAAMWGARSFGPLVGVLLALGLTALFPLGGVFLAGQPDDFSLSCVFALASVLALLAGNRAREKVGGTGDLSSADSENTATRRCFIIAGISGGLGLWINARVQVPILLGIVIGAIASSWFTSGKEASARRARSWSAWRAWAFAGALTSIAAYLVEYVPAHLDISALRLEVNHPLYALAWLGAGELIHRIHEFAATRQLSRAPRDVALMVGAVLALASVPVTIVLHGTDGFLVTDPADLRLAATADASVATSLWEWIKRDGITSNLGGTLLPLLTLIPAGWLLLRDRTADRSQAGRIALVLGPVLTLLVVACFRLRYWAVVDALLLVLIVAGLLPTNRSVVALTPRWWGIVALLCFVPGLWMLRDRVPAGSKDAVTELEAQSLVERDLAQWLSYRGGSERVVVLAPPSLTSSLVYFGAVRGLATPHWENFDGFAAAVRIAGATSMAEADSLMRRREVRFIVIPSWDSDLTKYAAIGNTDVASTLIGRLGRWLPPFGLRPIAYKLPQISGFEDRSIAVFASTDMQDDPLALSRLAEYFVEMGQLDFALRVAGTLLQKYPEDLNGIIARAQVAAGTSDSKEFGEALASLLPMIERGEDEGLPWDRRVGLAVVLAQAKRQELARKKLEQAVDEADETLLRSLSNGALYRLLTLMQRMNLQLPDAELRDLVPQLLPAEMRDTLR